MQVERDYEGRRRRAPGKIARDAWLRFKGRLASHNRISLRELGERFDGAELEFWRRFYAVEGWPEERADLRAAVLLRLISQFAGKSLAKKPLRFWLSSEWIDELPAILHQDVGPAPGRPMRAHPKPKSPAELEAKFRAFMLERGGFRVKDPRE